MKPIYILLGFIFLGLGVLGIILPLLPATPFLLLTLFFFAKGSDRLHNWFVQTKLYNNHLKSFKEDRSLSQKSKFWILLFATVMLSIGFYFTPSTIGRTIIVFVLLTKYWFFFFWIKTAKQ
ncbi:YbaN family protein [Pasteurella oralis]|uniref:Inner membrane protein n=1 Tax=Pasteurella oralis TaxID=1071947 RepID=A0ABW4NUC0_9PAST|nr:YbaN family protein [Pasteurella oralis]